MKPIAFSCPLVLAMVGIGLATIGCQETVASLHWKSFDLIKAKGATDLKLTGRDVDSSLCSDTPLREFIASGPTDLGVGSLLHGWACPDRLYVDTPHRSGPLVNTELPGWPEFDIMKDHDHWEHLTLTGRTAADLGCQNSVPAREFLAISVGVRGDKTYLHGWACPNTVTVDDTHY